MSRGSKSHIPLFVAVFGVVAVAGGQIARPESAPGNSSIREQVLKADLGFLASDGLAGRLTGTIGNQIATEFVRARFERLGLKPMARDGSYFESFTLITSSLGAANALTIEGDRVRREAHLRDDFYPQAFSASATASGPVVFVGFGIVASQIGYDDYRDVDVRGRIVLALDHEPGERNPVSPLDGLVSADAATPLRKTLAAQERGAAAILLVRDVHNHDASYPFSSESSVVWPLTPPRIPHYMLASAVERVRIPAVEISTDAAAVLLREAGRSLSSLARDSESLTGSTPRTLGNVRVQVTASVMHSPVADRNVVAATEGADPLLRNEWIVVGAHVDHDGADGSQIFNGADDNASGTVALLAVAEAYAEAARSGQRPRRSVLFASWNSEERGLLGSWAYADQPLVPLEKTIAAINIDMVGRNEEVPADGGRRFQGLPVQTAESNVNAVNLLGYSYAQELADVALRANALFGLNVRERYDNVDSTLLSRSDQWPFLLHGIPAIWFFGGLHPDYHMPADRAEKINYSKLERITRLIHQTSWELAERDQRPKLTKPAV